MSLNDTKQDVWLGYFIRRADILIGLKPLRQSVQDRVAWALDKTLPEPPIPAEIAMSYRGKGEKPTPKTNRKYKPRKPRR